VPPPFAPRIAAVHLGGGMSGDEVEANWNAVQLAMGRPTASAPSQLPRTRRILDHHVRDKAERPLACFRHGRKARLAGSGLSTAGPAVRAVQPVFATGSEMSIFDIVIAPAARWGPYTAV
jgi:hypothetical protein